MLVKTEIESGNLSVFCTCFQVKWVVFVHLSILLFLMDIVFVKGSSSNEWPPFDVSISKHQDSESTVIQLSIVYSCAVQRYNLKFDQSSPPSRLGFYCMLRIGTMLTNGGIRYTKISNPIFGPFEGTFRLEHLWDQIIDIYCFCFTHINFASRTVAELCDAFFRYCRGGIRYI